MLQAIVADVGGQGEQRGEGGVSDGSGTFLFAEGEGGAQVQHLARPFPANG